MPKKQPPKVEQAPEGVQITLPGYVLREEGPARAVTRTLPPPVRCPYCEAEGRAGRCKRSGSGGTPGSTTYECLECCDPERGRPSRFTAFPAS